MARTCPNRESRPEILYKSSSDYGIANPVGLEMIFVQPAHFHCTLRLRDLLSGSQSFSLEWVSYQICCCNTFTSQSVLSLRCLSESSYRAVFRHVLGGINLEKMLEHSQKHVPFGNKVP